MGPILFAHRHTMGGTPRYLPSKVLKQPRKLLLGCRSPATGFSFLILSYLVLDHFPCTFGSILSFCNHLSHLYPLEGPLKPLSSFYFFFFLFSPPFPPPQVQSVASSITFERPGLTKRYKHTSIVSSSSIPLSIDHSRQCSLITTTYYYNTTCSGKLETVPVSRFL